MPVPRPRSIGAATGRALLAALIALVTPTLGAAPAHAAGSAAAPAVAAAGRAPWQAPPPAGLAAEDVVTFLDGQLPGQLEREHIAGATVAVVQDGKVVAAKGYGLADSARGIPVTAERTLFRIGSNSKPFVGTAVMQMVEQGKLDLHTDVNRYLTALRIPEAFGRPITLQHLLTHTAGFEETNELAAVSSESDLTSLETYLTRAMPQRVYAPGSVTAYSNYGMSLAGYLVERVSGEPLGRYLRHHVFDPLGLLHTAYDQPVPPALAPDLSAGHRWTGSGFETLPFEWINSAPAGAISASATDMARFMIAHMGQGRAGSAQILQPDTAAQMHRQQYANDPRSPAGWGLTFLRTSINGLEVVGHGGNTQNFHSAMLTFPEHGAGIFVATNTLGNDDAPWEVVRAFADRFYPVHPAPVPAAPGASQRADRYVGYYTSTRRNHSTIEKLVALTSTKQITKNEDGTLSASFLDNPERPAKRWAETAPGVYRDTAGTDVIVFDDRDGVVTMFGGLPTAGLQKLPWYLQPALQAAALLVPPLLFLVTLVGLGVAALWRLARRLRGGRDRGAVARGPAAPRGWLALIAALNLLFVVGGYVLLATDPIDGFSNRSVALLVVLGVGVLAAAGDVGLGVLAVRSWLRRSGRPAGRAWLSLQAVAGLVFVAAMVQWNLLGWHV